MNRPIAVFDSGVGGLSVLRHLHVQLPFENIIYLADQAHVPYGGRSCAEIFEFSQAIVDAFLEQRAKLIVIACNTASTAAIKRLRTHFPTVLFVGTEPAVKPAAALTKSGKVGVLATAGTLASNRYGALMNHFAQDVQVWEAPCVGLVDLIESGQIDSSTKSILQSALEPMLAAGVDTIVLGCTHYPFVVPLIREIAGDDVSIIDPAPAIVKQSIRLLKKHQLAASDNQHGSLRLITSSGADRFQLQSMQLIGFDGEVETAVWRNGRLVLPDPA